MSLIPRDPRRASDDYRARTDSMLKIPARKRVCQGPCRTSRSIGQFVGDSTMCLQCVRRA